MILKPPGRSISGGFFRRVREAVRVTTQTTANASTTTIARQTSPRERTAKRTMRAGVAFDTPWFRRVREAVLVTTQTTANASTTTIVRQTSPSRRTAERTMRVGVSHEDLMLDGGLRGRWACWGEMMRLDWLVSVAW